MQLLDALKMLHPQVEETTAPERHTVNIDIMEYYDLEPNTMGGIPCVVVGHYKNSRYVLIEVNVKDIQ